MSLYSKRWPYIVAALILLGALLQEGTLITVGVLAGLALGIAWLWRRYALDGVEYERVFSQERAFPGETIDLVTRVTNRKLLPLPWLTIQDEFPTRLPLLKGKLEVTSQPLIGLLSHLVALRWYERVSWRHQLQATARGFYVFGPATVRSGDMFGLFEAAEERAGQSALIVYPRIVTLERLGLPSKNPFGEMRSPQRLFEDPSRTVGIRDYQTGDSFKRMHWKATARRQQLQVRVYEPTATPALAIFLNVSTGEHFWQGVDSVTLEQAITTAASLANWALEERYAVGLYCNAPIHQGDQPIRLRPSRNPQQLTAILESLAKLNPFAMMSLANVLEVEAGRLHWGATVIIVTATLSEPLQATILRLHEAGRRMVALTFSPAAEAVHIPGVVVQQVNERGAGT